MSIQSYTNRMKVRSWSVPLAALCTSSNLPLANPEKTIGLLGGRDVPVINDFKVGYIQGAHYIDPEIKSTCFICGRV